MNANEIIRAFNLAASAERDSRSGTAYVVILGTVRGETRVFVRDRATHNAVRTAGETLLAVAEYGRLHVVGGI